VYRFGGKQKSEEAKAIEEEQAKRID